MAKAKKIDLRKAPKEIRALRAESTLPETFERMLEQCAYTLDLLHKRFGIDFLIHSNEYNINLGTVEMNEAEEETPPKRRLTQPYGTVTGYIRPLIEDMQLDELRQIPVGDFEAGRLQSCIAAWASAHWGKGSYTCVVGRDKQSLEIWRLPTAGLRNLLPSLRGGSQHSSAEETTGGTDA
jgi:hypothetical protein